MPFDAPTYDAALMISTLFDPAPAADDALAHIEDVEVVAVDPNSFADDYIGPDAWADDLTPHVLPFEHLRQNPVNLWDQ